MFAAFYRLHMKLVFLAFAPETFLLWPDKHATLDCVFSFAPVFSQFLEQTLVLVAIRTIRHHGSEEFQFTCTVVCEISFRLSVRLLTPLANSQQSAVDDSKRRSFFGQAVVGGRWWVCLAAVTS